MRPMSHSIQILMRLPPMTTTRLPLLLNLAMVLAAGKNWKAAVAAALQVAAAEVGQEILGTRDKY